MRRSVGSWAVVGGLLCVVGMPGAGVAGCVLDNPARGEARTTDGAGAAGGEDDSTTTGTGGAGGSNDPDGGLHSEENSYDQYAEGQDEVFRPKGDINAGIVDENRPIKLHVGTTTTVTGTIRQESANVPDTDPLHISLDHDAVVRFVSSKSDGSTECADQKFSIKFSGKDEDSENPFKSIADDDKYDRSTACEFRTHYLAKDVTYLLNIHGMSSAANDEYIIKIIPVEQKHDFSLPIVVNSQEVSFAIKGLLKAGDEEELAFAFKANKLSLRAELIEAAPTRDFICENGNGIHLGAISNNGSTTWDNVNFYGRGYCSLLNGFAPGKYETDFGNMPDAKDDNETQDGIVDVKVYVKNSLPSTSSLKYLPYTLVISARP